MASSHTLCLTATCLSIQSCCDVCCAGRYMLIISLAFFVFTGAVGFYSCFFFVRKIYGSVKVD